MCLTEARRYLKGDCLRTGRTLGKYELFRKHRPVQPYVDPTSRTEPRKYVTLIRRFDTLDLLKCAQDSLCSVGVFVVKKKRRTQRLSADARTANQRFLSLSSKSGRHRGFEDEEVLNRQWVGSFHIDNWFHRYQEVEGFLSCHFAFPKRLQTAQSVSEKCSRNDDVLSSLWTQCWSTTVFFGSSYREVKYNSCGILL